MHAWQKADALSQRVIPARFWQGSSTRVLKNMLRNVYYVYILASKKNGTLYIGMTRDLSRRVWQHRQGTIQGFTKKYQIKMLIYYEMVFDVVLAIGREKQIKRWKRSWKIRLIQTLNPEWKDLYAKISGGWIPAKKLRE